MTRPVARGEPMPGAAQPGWLPAALLASAVLVLTVYVWLISVGTWVSWPGRWRSYDSLASAFLKGQLSLPTQPDPALLALDDPYDPAAREGISYPQDASLYDGKFYLYFGPAPALLIALARCCTEAPIGDQHLVFLFVAGLFLLQLSLIRRIRRRYFPNSSPWTLVPLVIAAGLVNPWPWMLSTPSVYTAAITAGQFFFLGGLHLALSTVEDDERPPAWQLALAGICWAAAVASRLTQALPVCVMLALLAARSLLRRRTHAMPSAALEPLMALVLSFCLGVAALGWYNWARFGSVLETGLRYQLAGVQLEPYGSSTFSPHYVLQNLYNYLLNPPRLKYAFPYLSPVRGSTSSVSPWIRLPAAYRAQEMLGLLYSAPLLVLSVLPTFSPRRKTTKDDDTRHEIRGLRWLVAGLSGTFLTAFAFLLFFFWAAERYTVDFFPELFLVSVIGVWQLDRKLTSRPKLRIAFWVLSGGTLLASIIAGLLLAMSYNADGFRALNPVLWRQLSNLFRP